MFRNRIQQILSQGTSSYHPMRRQPSKWHKIQPVETHWESGFNFGQIQDSSSGYSSSDTSRPRSCIASSIGRYLLRNLPRNHPLLHYFLTKMLGCHREREPMSAHNSSDKSWRRWPGVIKSLSNVQQPWCVIKSNLILHSSILQQIEFHIRIGLRHFSIQSELTDRDLLHQRHLLSLARNCGWKQPGRDLLSLPLSMLLRYLPTELCSKMGSERIRFLINKIILELTSN